MNQYDKGNFIFSLHKMTNLSSALAGYMNRGVGVDVSRVLPIILTKAFWSKPTA
jgi:hypothetical protein